MYDAFYKWSGKPFQLNPDPMFYFQSQGHQRAMAYLRYGLQQGEGFIVVTGDVGTGKTMLVNNLFKEIEDKDVVAAKIVSTNVSESDLLRIVSAQFDLPYEQLSKAALLQQLEAFFKACIDEGKRVLLVVDEAQNLPRSSLEELRMLSNLDYKGAPVVQSFLLGQREFRTVMRAPGLEQLRQRVLAAYHLKPLSAPETKTYVIHRLHKVGWTADPLVDDNVYWGIFQFTNGVPRRINTLADRLFLSACLEEAHHVTLPMLEAVIAEIVAEQDDEGSDSAESEVNGGGPTRATAVARPVPASSARVASDGGAVEDSNVAIRKMEARLAALQRAFDNLSEELQKRADDGAGRDTSTGAPGPRHMTWGLAVSGVLVVLGMAGAVTWYLMR